MALPAMVMGVLLIIAIMTTFIYKSLSRSQDTVAGVGTPSELIYTMDRLIGSIESKREHIRRRIEFAKNEDVVDILVEEKIAPASRNKMLLTGVVYATSRPLAIINDRGVSLNAEINGFKVIEIKEKSIIIVDKEGSERTVYLYEPE